MNETTLPLPDTTVSSDAFMASLTPKQIVEELDKYIVGQTNAKRAVGIALRNRWRRQQLPDSLRDEVGPKNILMIGPTGVGKTEVTQQLALTLGIELVRFDMSEYMERHTVSRLIGAPPGYVGFDQGGLMTEAITRNPHSVLLLDEIEKAHPDVFNLLLQVMDYGTLTDNNGRKADFRNVIIVMTTNAGAMQMARGSVGFVNQDHSADDTEIINKMFAPEFRNRLDSVIRFGALDEATIGHVVDKFIVQLETQLADKHVVLEVDQGARQWLAKNGHDALMGARPMARLIRDRINRALADELLFGKLAQGGTVRVYEKEGELAFEIDSVGES